MTEASQTTAIGIGSEAEQLTAFANELEAAINAFIESYGDAANAKAKQAWLDLMWNDKGLFPYVLRLAASRLKKTDLYALFYNHYWDSFHSDKDIIMLHVQAVLDLAFPNEEGN